MAIRTFSKAVSAVMFGARSAAFAPVPIVPRTNVFAGTEADNPILDKIVKYAAGSGAEDRDRDGGQAQDLEIKETLRTLQAIRGVDRAQCMSLADARRAWLRELKQIIEKNAGGEGNALPSTVSVDYYLAQTVAATTMMEDRDCDAMRGTNAAASRADEVATVETGEAAVTQLLEGIQKEIFGDGWELSWTPRAEVLDEASFLKYATYAAALAQLAAYNRQLGERCGICRRGPRRAEGTKVAAPHHLISQRAHAEFLVLYLHVLVKIHASEKQKVQDALRRGGGRRGGEKTAEDVGHLFVPEHESPAFFHRLCVVLQKLAFVQSRLVSGRRGKTEIAADLWFHEWMLSHTSASEAANPGRTMRRSTNFLLEFEQRWGEHVRRVDAVELLSVAFQEGGRSAVRGAASKFRLTFSARPPQQGRRRGPSNSKARAADAPKSLMTTKELLYVALTVGHPRTATTGTGVDTGPGPSCTSRQVQVHEQPRRLRPECAEGARTKNDEKAVELSVTSALFGVEAPSRTLDPVANPWLVSRDAFTRGRATDPEDVTGFLGQKLLDGKPGSVLLDEGKGFGPAGDFARMVARYGCVNVWRAYFEIYQGDQCRRSAEARWDALTRLWMLQNGSKSRRARREGEGSAFCSLEELKALGYASKSKEKENIFKRAVPPPPGALVVYQRKRQDTEDLKPLPALGFASWPGDLEDSSRLIELS